MEHPIKVYNALQMFLNKNDKIPNETNNDLVFILDSISKEDEKIGKKEELDLSLTLKTPHTKINSLCPVEWKVGKKKIKKFKMNFSFNGSKITSLTPEFVELIRSKKYFYGFLVDTFWMIYCHFYLINKVETGSYSLPNENREHLGTQNNISATSPFKQRVRHARRVQKVKKKNIKKQFFFEYKKLVKRMGTNFIKIKYLLKLEVLENLKSLSDIVKDNSTTSFAMFLTQISFKIFRMTFPSFFFSFYWRKLCYIFIRKWCIGGVKNEYLLFPFEKKFLMNYKKYWTIVTSSKCRKPTPKKRSIKTNVRATLWARKFVKRGKSKMIRRKIEKQWKTFLKETKADNLKKIEDRIKEIDKRNAEMKVGVGVGVKRTPERRGVVNVFRQYRRNTVLPIGGVNGKKAKKRKKDDDVNVFVTKMGKKRHSVTGSRPGMFMLKSHKVTSPLINSYLYSQQFFKRKNFRNKLECL